MELLVFPVSVVLKIWHLFLHSLLGVEATLAWVIAVLGLVITVRLLLLPFFWASRRSSRASALMRPELIELEDKYRRSTNPHEVMVYQAAKKELQQRHGYRASAGCVPPLVQIPVLLGLYRLLMWLGRPETHKGTIGILSNQNIAQFRQATLFGIPLPAHMNMSQEAFDALGTTLADVRSLAIPMLFTAVFFTAANMTAALLRSRRALDWSKTSARVTQAIVSVLGVIAPLMLLSLGWWGPIPIALLMYWFINSLWTLSQTIIIDTVVAIRFPATEKFRQTQKALREALDEEVEARRKEREKEKQQRLEITRRTRGMPFKEKRKIWTVVSHYSRQKKIERELDELYQKVERSELNRLHAKIKNGDKRRSKKHSQEPK